MQDKFKVFLQIITWVLLPQRTVPVTKLVDVWTSANAQLTELAMKTLEKIERHSTSG
jgi:hypothetical protein